MTAKKNVAVAAVAGLSLVIASPVVQATAQEAPGGAGDTGASAAESRIDRATATAVRLDRVQGQFAFDQGTVTPTSTIRQSLYEASKYLCGASAAPDAAETKADEWPIAVSGDVENAFSATVSELAEDGAAKITMGCTCAGNPVDGRASVNAHVEGVTIRSILERARPAETVNTITFVSEDGYRVSLPLSYVQYRYSMIVYGMNGEDFCDVAGSANQLWLGATAAKYFTQNVSEIILTEEVDVPPAPGTADSDDSRENLPNVSVTEAA